MADARAAKGEDVLFFKDVRHQPRALEAEDGFIAADGDAAAFLAAVLQGVESEKST